MFPSYIKDISNFINKISETENITEDTFLDTLGLKSLYTNVPNHEGIEETIKAIKAIFIK